MIQKHREKNDDAVSPVVGVMLMLVITIIIASLVAAFSSGIIDSGSVAPKAYFDVKISVDEQYTDENNYAVMVIEHLGGDSVDTADLQIRTHYTYDYVDPETDTLKPIRATTTIDSTTTQTYLYSSSTKNPRAKVPYLADVNTGVPGDSAVNFGSFEFTAGDIMTTGTTTGTARMLGLVSGTTPSYNSLKAAVLPGNTNGFGPGSKVEVQIIHKPSGGTLFTKEVIVE